MPRVSIITLCHNDEQYLGECIASVEAQTYRDFEHVIVDCTSTVPVRAATLRLNQYRGISSSRNFGVKQSSGQFIMQLDADDKIHPQYLEKIMAKACIGRIVCPQLEEVGGRRGLCGAPAESDCKFEAFLRCNPIYCCSMYSFSDWEEVGGYDPALDSLGCEDYEFWTALVKSGCKVKVVPEAIFYYRVRADSFTERLGAKMNEGRAYVRRKHGTK